MASSSYTLTITNREIYEFYKERNLNFETMNLLFVEIIRNITRDLDNSKKNINDIILKKMTEFECKLSAIGENYSKLNGDISNIIAIRLNDFKKDYVEDVKHIIHTNTTDKIEPLIKENGSVLLDKTKLFISEIIPKENEDVTKNIGHIIEKFQSSVAHDTEKLLNNTLNDNSLNEFLKSLDNKFSQTIVSTQNIVNALVNSSESRLESKIIDVKNSTQDIKHIKETQNGFAENLSKLLRKMENSSIKGKMSENVLNSILQELFPSGEIESVGNQTAKGDFILKRANKPTILIENKNYEKNVNKDEVNKFIRDIDENNCCGLFLSQNGGIANKENFEFNFHKGNVLFYLHDANNDLHKIKFAIHAIDSIKIKMDELNQNENSHTNGIEVIDKDTLAELNREYQAFINQKTTLIKTAKEMSQKIIQQADELQMPCLEKYLSKIFAFSVAPSSAEICPLCNTFWKNKQALSAHLRACKTGRENVSEQLK